MASYTKNKATLESENKALEAEVKELREKLEGVQKETTEIKADFGTMKATLSEKKDKPRITSEQFEAMRIYPGNLRKVIKRAGWPPDIEAAIIEKAL